VAKAVWSLVAARKRGGPALPPLLCPSQINDSQGVTWAGMHAPPLSDVPCCRVVCLCYRPIAYANTKRPEHPFGPGVVYVAPLALSPLALPAFTFLLDPLWVARVAHFWLDPLWITCVPDFRLPVFHIFARPPLGCLCSPFGLYVVPLWLFQRSRFCLTPFGLLVLHILAWPPLGCLCSTFFAWPPLGWLCSLFGLLFQILLDPLWVGCVLLLFSCPLLPSLAC
jgi:hypothetical protein